MCVSGTDVRGGGGGWRASRLNDCASWYFRVVPLHTSAASAAFARQRWHAPHKVWPRTEEFGGCSPRLMRDMQQRAITECYTLAARSISRHFACPEGWTDGQPKGLLKSRLLPEGGGVEGVGVG